MQEGKRVERKGEAGKGLREGGRDTLVPLKLTKSWKRPWCCIIVYKELNCYSFRSACGRDFTTIYLTTSSCRFVSFVLIGYFKKLGTYTSPIIFANACDNRGRAIEIHTHICGLAIQQIHESIVIKLINILVMGQPFKLINVSTTFHLSTSGALCRRQRRFLEVITRLFYIGPYIKPEHQQVPDTKPRAVCRPTA